jgi:hypothetical protein
MWINSVSDLPKCIDRCFWLIILFIICFCNRRPMSLKHFFQEEDGIVCGPLQVTDFGVGSAEDRRCLRAASELPQNCLRTASELPQNGLRTASELPKNCLRTASERSGTTKYQTTISLHRVKTTLLWKIRQSEMMHLFSNYRSLCMYIHKYVCR